MQTDICTTDDDQLYLIVSESTVRVHVHTMNKETFQRMQN